MSGLIQKSTPIEELVYCSSANAMTSLNIPIQNTSDPRIPKLERAQVPGSTQDFVKAVNFLAIAATTLFTISAKPQPCVNWFGPGYPTSSIYEQPPNASSPYFISDSTYNPEPLGGWLSLLNPGSNLSASEQQANLQLFQKLQLRPFYLYSKSDATANINFGQRTQSSLLPLVAIAAGSANSTARNFSSFSPQTNLSGLLDGVENRYWVDIVRNTLI